MPQFPTPLSWPVTRNEEDLKRKGIGAGQQPVRSIGPAYAVAFRLILFINRPILFIAWTSSISIPASV